MDQNKKMTAPTLNWRIIYQLISGLLFIALGIVIFVRGDGYKNFFNAGLFGILLGAYGAYRLAMFFQVFNKIKRGTQ